MFKRRYKVNHNFFNSLNEKNSYILGLLAADGNVSKIGARLTLSICEKDSKILGEINHLLESTYPITTYIVKKKYKQKILRITSKDICNDLNSYGIIPKKSLKMTFPSIPKKYLSHYIRGYFDGDGSITITKSNNIAITILGTKQFLKEIKKLYNEYCNTDCGWIAQHNKSRIYHFCIHGNVGGIKFLKWIYKNESIKFDRKYKIYTNFMSSF